MKSNLIIKLEKDFIKINKINTFLKSGTDTYIYYSYNYGRTTEYENIKKGFFFGKCINIRKKNSLQANAIFVTEIKSETLRKEIFLNSNMIRKLYINNVTKKIIKSKYNWL